MRVFIQCDSTGHPCNTNAFAAFEGLQAMGYECVFFQKYEELIEHNHSKEELIISGIRMIERRLHDFGIECTAINYPKELASYFGRLLWKSNINKIANTPALWPVFIKSVEGKRLSGRVISTSHDLVGCGCCDDNYEVLCSKPVDFMVADAVTIITRCYVANLLILLQSGESLSDMEKYSMSDPIKGIGKCIIIQA